MKLNSNFLSGAVGVFLGIISGVAVTAYGIGIEQATTSQKIITNTRDIEDIKTSINNKLDQINQSVNEMKVDISALKAIVSRLEQKK